MSKGNVRRGSTSENYKKIEDKTLIISFLKDGYARF